MKLLFIVLSFIALSTTAFPKTDMSNLKQVLKHEMYERYKILNSSFFIGKNFVYYTVDSDSRVICYDLKVDKELNFSFSQKKNMQMNGKFSFDGTKITLTGTAILAGGVKITKPEIFELNPEYDVYTSGEKSPDYDKNNRFLSVSLKKKDNNLFQTIVFNCEKDSNCSSRCL